MATANPLGEDNYELELSLVREKIKTEFIELIDCLKARGSKLLRELDNMITTVCKTNQYYFTIRFIIFVFFT